METSIEPGPIWQTVVVYAVVLFTVIGFSWLLIKRWRKTGGCGSGCGGCGKIKRDPTVQEIVDRAAR